VHTLQCPVFLGRTKLGELGVSANKGRTPLPMARWLACSKRRPTPATPGRTSLDEQGALADSKGRLGPDAKHAQLLLPPHVAVPFCQEPLVRCPPATKSSCLTRHPKHVHTAHLPATESSSLSRRMKHAHTAPPKEACRATSACGFPGGSQHLCPPLATYWRSSSQMGQHCGSSSVWENCTTAPPLASMLFCCLPTQDSS